MAFGAAPGLRAAGVPGRPGPPGSGGSGPGLVIFCVRAVDISCADSGTGSGAGSGPLGVTGSVPGSSG
ncbi:hypothetical protein UO65_4745 [Actinokineospora spheciospongiae]|uniref:Uncharacterized protein n=1 Tax=Actinokineospora spheciospongiae TaxID=909613 RepID=W7IGE8_9PSEU|nr:hypothetical protein UO65_4745 [Actinokineospora spheciospongiae]